MTSTEFWGFFDPLSPFVPNVYTVCMQICPFPFSADVIYESPLRRRRGELKLLFLILL